VCHNSLKTNAGPLPTMATMQFVAMLILAGTAAQSRAPSSPWLALETRPPAEGAMGVLVGNAPGKNKYEVAWSSGSTSVEDEANLVPTPEPWRLPTIGPSPWPAIFDVVEGRALVFGRQGWGWIDLHGDINRVAVRSSELHEALRRMDEELLKQRGEIFTRHKPILVVVKPQALRRRPGDDAPSAGAMPLGTDERQCSVGVDEMQRLVRPRTSKVTLTPRDVPIRVVEERDDWIKVVLPRRGTPIYSCMDGALISWDEHPAGWVRAAIPGPVKGTKVMLWHVMSWGTWP
jgi:hypothetical protein